MTSIFAAGFVVSRSCVRCGVSLAGTHGLRKYCGPCKRVVEHERSTSPAKREYNRAYDARRSQGGGGRGTHGQTVGGKRTPTYSTWENMKSRCTNPTVPSYSYYGGRGIEVCSRWQGPEGFLNFIADMGERPREMTLDRVDVNGNYEPANCRWATASEQRCNQRVTQC